MLISYSGTLARPQTFQAANQFAAEKVSCDPPRAVLTLSYFGAKNQFNVILTDANDCKNRLDLLIFAGI